MKFFDYHPTEETASRCLALIERHAPRLMRQGGGHLSEEILRSGQRLSVQQQQRIVRLRKKGLSAQQVAAEVGVSHVTVYKTCQAAGMKRPRSVRRFSDEVVAQMRALRMRGFTMKRIAGECGCSVSAVDKRLRDAM